MLGTRERRHLLGSLRPPAGYRLRRAVGTSFTLDLMALLTVPLAFTFFDAHDEDGAPVADPVVLLEALRRQAAKITLFCQAGAIGVPRPDQRLLAYLERSVIEVQPARKGGIFHPKVWVLHFESAEGPAVYRVLCLSRNLTFARAWDTCLRLDGQLAPRESGYPQNEPLADLLLALPGLAIRETRAELCEDLERMASDIRRVDFQPPRPFSDFRIHNFGLHQRQEWPFPKGGRSLVMSPYLAGRTVRDLLRDHGLEVLVSRPEAFEDVVREVGREVLPRTCYVLSPAAGLDARDVQKEAEERSDGPPSVEGEVELSGLHAKLYLFEKGRDARLFTGSANGTRAALHANIEVLVELVGRTKDCGIASFLGSDDKSSLQTIRSLLDHYRPPENPGPEPTERKLQRDVDRLARNLAAAPFTATAQHVDAEQRWDLSLSGQLPEIRTGAAVKVWPATLSAQVAKRIDGRREERHAPIGPAEEIATFRGMSFEALTAFFAFEVSLREEQHEVRKRFVVTTELIGAPEDRHQRLLSSILTDRRRVLQLLMLILRGEGADVSAFVQAARPGGAAGDGSFGGWDRATLLEVLLQALSRNPARIDQLATLISDLERTPEGKNLLPEDLDKIWQPVWDARKTLRS